MRSKFRAALGVPAVPGDSGGTIGGIAFPSFAAAMRSRDQPDASSWPAYKAQQIIEALPVTRTVLVGNESFQRLAGMGGWPASSDEPVVSTPLRSRNCGRQRRKKEPRNCGFLPPVLKCWMLAMWEMEIKWDCGALNGRTFVLDNGFGTLHPYHMNMKHGTTRPSLMTKKGENNFNEHA